MRTLRDRNVSKTIRPYPSANGHDFHEKARFLTRLTHSKEDRNSACMLGDPNTNVRGDKSFPSTATFRFQVRTTAHQLFPRRWPG